MPETAARARRATNVTLPAELLQEARARGVNLSQACERGLEAVLAEARRQDWQRENAEAIKGWNEFTEANGIPLAEYRQF